MIHFIRGLFLISVLAITISFAFKILNPTPQPEPTLETKQETTLPKELSPIETKTPAKTAPKTTPKRSELKSAADTVNVEATADVNFITWYILIPAFGAVAIIFIDMFWRSKQLNVLGGLFFGIIAGLIGAWVMALIVDMISKIYQIPMSEPIVPLVKWLLGATCLYFCVTIVMQTKDEFRFIIPYVEFTKQTKGNHPLVLDTSVIIDGRIVDVMETKVIQSDLIVPRFVLTELQAVADSEDKLKRNRGRRGLDVLQKLQHNPEVDVNILEFRVPTVDQATGVDSKLIALCEHLSARIITNDYNLNKVAKLRGLDVINLNDIANALKPIVLPGERMKVKIIKTGEEAGQGVAYLDDGTMVVADQARSHIGKMVNISVTSVLQTSAGRMIFGKYEDDNV